MKLSILFIFIVLFNLHSVRLAAQETETHFYLAHQKNNGFLKEISGQIDLVQNSIKPNGPEVFYYDFGKANPFGVAEQELNKKNFDLSDLFFSWTECLNNKTTVVRNKLPSTFENVLKKSVLWELLLTPEEIQKIQFALASMFDPKSTNTYIYDRLKNNSTTQVRDLIFDTLLLDKNHPNIKQTEVTAFEAEQDSVASLIDENIPESSGDPKAVRTLSAEIFQKFNLQTASLFTGFPYKLYSAKEYAKLLDNMRYELSQYFPDSEIKEGFENYYFQENIRKQKLSAYDSLFTSKRLLDALKQIADHKIKLYEQKN